MTIRELAIQFSLQMALFPLHYAIRTITDIFLLYFGKLVPENVKCLFLVVDVWHACMPG